MSLPIKKRKADEEIEVNPSDESDLSLERRSGFFNGPDVIKFGLISIRLFFNSVKHQYVVYIGKDKRYCEQVTDSFISLSSPELPELIMILKSACWS